MKPKVKKETTLFQCNKFKGVTTIQFTKTQTYSGAYGTHEDEQVIRWAGCLNEGDCE